MLFFSNRRFFLNMFFSQLRQGLDERRFAPPIYLPPFILSIRDLSKGIFFPVKRFLGFSGRPPRFSFFPGWVMRFSRRFSY